MYKRQNKNSLERPEVKTFVTFYLENAEALTREVGYVPLESTGYKVSLELIK